MEDFSTFDIEIPLGSWDMFAEPNNKTNTG